MTTLSKWRYPLGLLLAFVVGWQLAPQFAATSWYGPVTRILVLLRSLGLGSWDSGSSSRKTKNPQKPAPKNRVRMTYSASPGS